MATILSSSETSTDRPSHVIDPANFELLQTQPIEILLQPNRLPPTKLTTATPMMLPGVVS
ncbi:hypothetical protein [Lacisediminihabitans profunda]|uniref:Uncharacterized protein n=1 Tax=Lacisediminihabitans profunda TaxID=2594790 RepID=A0A5C8UVD7_9MICO|nr:hypothetical protein [Lacisediminihabitans profunda]TXN32290.1 hypothetical protein FVP33_01270 [Lacisediminihabitans profunda]